MRVVWFTNIPLEGQQAGLDLKLKGSGFWMSELASALVATGEIQLVSACVSPRLLEKRFQADGVAYRSAPVSRDSDGMLDRVRRIIDEEKPDLVHIHGTERPYGLVNTAVPVVISLQGLVSEIWKRAYGSLSILDVLRTVRLRAILTRSTLIHKRSAMIRSGVDEVAILRQQRYFIGRTPWDRSVVLRHNPGALYYTGDEIMRSPFYQRTWTRDGCNAQTILVGNVGAPWRGTETVLEAFGIVAARFPDARLAIMGNMDGKDGYTGRLRAQVSAHTACDRIACTGYLDAEGLSRRMQESGVFVLASSVENSPNSLCEAMCVGMPVVGSFVGGVPDLVRDHESGRLFPFGDATLLAGILGELFVDRPQAAKLGERARVVARHRHGRERVARQYLDIYRECVRA